MTMRGMLVSISVTFGRNLFVPTEGRVPEGIREAIAQDAAALGSVDHDVRRDLGRIFPGTHAGYTGRIQRLHGQSSRRS